MNKDMSKSMKEEIKKANKDLDRNELNRNIFLNHEERLLSLTRKLYLNKDRIDLLEDNFLILYKKISISFMVLGCCIAALGILIIISWCL